MAFSFAVVSEVTPSSIGANGGSEDATAQPGGPLMARARLGDRPAALSTRDAESGHELSRHRRAVAKPQDEAHEGPCPTPIRRHLQQLQGVP
jgi:hypothetical protein